MAGVVSFRHGLARAVLVSAVSGQIQGSLVPDEIEAGFSHVNSRGLRFETLGAAQGFIEGLDVEQLRVSGL